MKLLHFVYMINYVKWLFSSSPKWAEAGFRVMLKYFEINTSFICSNLFRYYIKQIDSMLPGVCSVIDHRRRQNVVRALVTHSAIASCATFSILPRFDVTCYPLHGIYLKTDIEGESTGVNDLGHIL